MRELRECHHAVAELEDGLPLPVAVGSDDDVLLHGELAQTCDEELAEHDENGDPEGADTDHTEVDEGGADEDLVRERVDELAKVRHLIESTSDVAIEVVGEGPDDEGPAGDDFGDGDSLGRRGDAQREGEDDDEGETRQGDAIRDVQHDDKCHDYRQRNNK